MLNTYQLGGIDYPNNTINTIHHEFTQKNEKSRISINEEMHLNLEMEKCKFSIARLDFLQSILVFAEYFFVLHA